MAPCDWRVQVTDCDDAGFFLGVWQLGGALSAMSLLFSVVLLVYRFGVQRLSMFWEGEVRGHELMIIISTLFTVLDCVYSFTIQLDWGRFDGARDMVFVLRYLFALTARNVFLLTLLRSIPFAYIDANKQVRQSWVPARNVQQAALVVLEAILLVSMIVLNAVLGYERSSSSSSKSDGDSLSTTATTGLVGSLHTVVFGFLSGYSAVIGLVVVMFGLHFHSIMRLNLADLDMSDAQNQLIALHTLRMRLLIVFYTVMSLIMFVFFLIMATADDAYSNMALSKVVASVLVCVLVAMLLMLLGISAYLDHRRSMIHAAVESPVLTGTGQTVSRSRSPFPMLSIAAATNVANSPRHPSSAAASVVTAAQLKAERNNNMNSLKSSTSDLFVPQRSASNASLPIPVPQSDASAAPSPVPVAALDLSRPTSPAIRSLRASSNASGIQREMKKAASSSSFYRGMKTSRSETLHNQTLLNQTLLPDDSLDHFTVLNDVDQTGAEGE